MAFTPLVKRPWGIKPRTAAWKATASLAWLAIICALWTCGFFLITSQDPGNQELYATTGEILGAAGGVLFAIGLMVILTRPKAL